MQETRKGQPKLGIIRLSSHRGRDCRYPVIGIQTGDDLAALRLAIATVQHPQHFDHRVIRFGPGIGVIDLALVKGRNLQQLLRQGDRRIRYPAKKGVIAWEAARLGTDCIN